MFGFDGVFLRGSAGTCVLLETRKEKAGQRVELGFSTSQVDGGDGERVEKVRVPSDGWLLPSHRPCAA